MSETALDEQQLRRLLRVGRSLVANLDLETMLDELIETARELTGARYAALGVLDESRQGLERFIARGIDPVTHRAIGDLPRGRGILGVLIEEPRPLRLRHLGDDPRSFGFPAHHPPMDTFLGVPIVIRGEAWGNLYLTEKEGGGAFTDADEAAIVVVADWAGIAVDNARLYRGSEERRTALEQAVAGLEAMTSIARAIGGETDLDRVLELIVERGRALIDARALVIVLGGGEQVQASAGAGDADLAHARSLAPGPQADATRTALVVPLTFQGRALGVLCAFDHLGADPAFDAEHEHVLLAFAASAATAVATATTVAEERLRHSIRAAEEERGRWARELHDDTLQSMAGLRLMLASAVRRGDAEGLQTAARAAVEDLATNIDALRSLITDLRPAALDQLGLAPALQALGHRVTSAHDVDVAVDVALGPADADRLEPETETAVYRVVQEALTNAVRHGDAARVHVSITDEDGRVAILVRDDGRGFDTAARRDGFGLAGMHERTALLGGELHVESSPDGTAVRAVVPARRRAG